MLASEHPGQQLCGERVLSTLAPTTPQNAQRATDTKIRVLRELTQMDYSPFACLL